MGLAASESLPENILSIYDPRLRYPERTPAAFSLWNAINMPLMSGLFPDPGICKS
jgi:hypothetical protein